jgi:hypothetical protein
VFGFERWPNVLEKEERSCIASAQENIWILEKYSEVGNRG